MTLYKKVLVVWKDAASIDEWKDPEEVRSLECNIIESCGWLISDSAEQLILSMNRDTHSDQLSCTIVLPKSTVLSVRILPD